jgi:hypothetical protein
VIDTPGLPVPYNAVEGNYALVAFVGAYQNDTLHIDTAAFVKLQGIPCDSIDQLQARCVSGGTIQARAVLLNSTQYEGDEVVMSIDGVEYTLTIGTNGTHSRASTQLTGQTLGDHTVELVSPAGCFSPVTVTCATGSAGADQEWESSVIITDVGDDEESPQEFSLSQNYPNPFNPATVIGYGLPLRSHVRLELFNPLGQSVALLVDGEKEAGYHSVTLESRALASGLYFYRLQAGDFVETKKLIILR